MSVSSVHKACYLRTLVVFSWWVTRVQPLALGNMERICSFVAVKEAASCHCRAEWKSYLYFLSKEWWEEVLHLVWAKQEGTVPLWQSWLVRVSALLGPSWAAWVAPSLLESWCRGRQHLSTCWATGRPGTAEVTEAELLLSFRNTCWCWDTRVTGTPASCGRKATEWEMSEGQAGQLRI